ncbi:MAG TPA: hypothetical protein VNE39_01145 [Planctomycetota bacterium]|nr:hypothetical protein [Planctomycetota bacterium]
MISPIVVVPRPSSSIVFLLALAAVGLAGEGLTVGKPFDLTPELATGDQRWPAIAAGGGVYLVVWQEGEAMAGVRDTQILAARVAPDGKPLDPKGFPVCRADGLKSYPAVSFDGANFLVVWQDYRGKRDWDAYAARVTPEGKVLDADGFAVAAVEGNQIYPSVASDGKRSLVVWSDVRPSSPPELYRLYGSFVQDGKPVEPGGKELARDKCSLLLPHVAYDGEGFGIVAGHAVPGWQPALPYAIRVSADGQAQPWKIPPFLGWTHSVASDPAGKRFLVWSNARGEHGSYQVWYLAGVCQPDGSGARHAVLGLQERHPPRNDLWCAAAFDGKSFVAVVEQSSLVGENPRHEPVSVRLVATRLDPADARPLDAGGTPAAANLTDLRSVYHTPAGKEAKAKATPGVQVAAEPGVQLRQPALASLGGGKSLVVYSRHAGVGRFKIHGVVLEQ